MGWTRLDSTTILRHVQEMIAILKGNFYQENKKFNPHESTLSEIKNRLKIYSQTKNQQKYTSVVQF